MTKKLTLKLNDGVIARAKEYAKSHNVSLSKLIESYLEALTSDISYQHEVTTLVESLTGVIDLKGKEDHKKKYTEYLQEKYK